MELTLTLKERLRVLTHCSKSVEGTEVISASIKGLTVCLPWARYCTKCQKYNEGQQCHGPAFWRLPGWWLHVINVRYVGNAVVWTWNAVDVTKEMIRKTSEAMKYVWIYENSQRASGNMQKVSSKVTTLNSVFQYRISLIARCNRQSVQIWGWRKNGISFLVICTIFHQVPLLSSYNYAYYSSYCLVYSFWLLLFPLHDFLITLMLFFCGPDAF